MMAKFPFKNRKSYLLLLSAMMVLAGVFLFLSYVGKSSPLLIGFVGALTGKYSDLGVQVRNGVQLAVEKINSSGGINGREIRMVYLDNRGTIQQCIYAFERLSNMGVKVVIGPMISSFALSVLPVAQENGIVIISPTVSTSWLSDKKDLFFRIIPDNKSRARALARYVIRKHNPQKICVLQDISNKAYTEDFLTSFLAPFNLTTSTIDCILRYEVTQNIPPEAIIDVMSILKHNPDVVVIAASSADTAFFARAIWNRDPSIVVCATNWAKTSLFILGLGTPVYTVYLEGIESGSRSRQLKHFEKVYLERFGWKPSFAAVQGYDSVRILAFALKKCAELSIPLNEALTEIKKFPGLFSSITINEYGDAVRPTFIYSIENGQFKVVGKVE